MNPYLRRAAGIVATLVGVGGIAALIYSMNELAKPPRRDETRAAKEFQVDKAPEKKKPRPSEPRPKPRQAARELRRAPLPNVTTTLSGLSFDLPQFQIHELAGAEELLGGDAGRKLVMTAETVDTKPVPRSQVAPPYPPRARERGIEGQVTLKLKVSDGGDVEDVKVIEADPPGIFEEVTLAAVRQWKFDPARYKGQPVAISVSQRIPFRLN
jgi:protein TonB